MWYLCVDLDEVRLVYRGTFQSKTNDITSRTSCCCTGDEMLFCLWKLVVVGGEGWAGWDGGSRRLELASRIFCCCAHSHRLLRAPLPPHTHRTGSTGHALPGRALDDAANASPHGPYPATAAKKKRKGSDPAAADVRVGGPPSPYSPAGRSAAQYGRLFVLVPLV